MRGEDWLCSAMAVLGGSLLRTQPPPGPSLVRRSIELRVQRDRAALGCCPRLVNRLLLDSHWAGAVAVIQTWAASGMRDVGIAVVENR